MHYGLNGYYSLAGIDAGNDAKTNNSALVRDTLENYQGNKVDKCMSYAQAARIKKDVAQYNPWSSSWAPLSAGGWYSSDEINAKANEIMAGTAALCEKKPEIKKVIAGPDIQTIEATCEDKAIDVYGPIFGRSSIAKLLTCHSTAVKIGAGVTGLAILALVFRPYLKILTGR